MNIDPVDLSSESRACRVTISFNHYQTKDDIIIRFDDDTNDTGDYFNFITRFELVKQNEPIVSYVELVCSFSDLCDKIFVDEWIRSLANFKHESLRNKLVYLLTSGTQASQCYARHKLIECPSGICSTRSSPVFPDTGLYANCAADISSPSYSSLSATFLSSGLRPMICKELKYNCTSQYCNGQLRFSRVWKETQILSKLMQPIVDWLSLQDDLKRFLSQLVVDVPTTVTDLSYDQTELTVAETTEAQSYDHVKTKSSSLSEIETWILIYVLIFFSLCVCLCCVWCCQPSDAHSTIPTCV